MSAAAGIDLGGTQIKGVMVDESGAVLRRELRPTKDHGALRWADTVRTLADEFGSELALGIAAPGLAASDGRSIASMPGRLQGLAGLDWTDFLQRASAVPVLNDAHASLLGEAWIGAARRCRNVIMLTLGTGVGGAILVNGELLRGHVGRAGHLGHVCLDIDGSPSITGMPGALECFIGNYNIRERTGGDFISTHELIAALRSGDAQAEAHWDRSMRALSCALASFINILDPELIVIGGGIASAGELLFKPLETIMAAVEWRPTGQAVPIVPAQLGEWAGAIGAARQAMLANAIE